MAKINKRQGKCWEWKGRAGWCGYGGFVYLDDPATGAHRMSWSYYNKKKIPKGMVICHKCDNPPCVNPDHLFLGTHKDNAQDMAKKKRTGKIRAKASFRYLTNEEFLKGLKALHRR